LRIGTISSSEEVPVDQNVKLLILVVSLCVFMFFSSCEHRKSDWQGTIEKANGVTVVHNPIEPLYGEGTCSILEEFSIGMAEGPEVYMFSGIMDMAVDDDGNIYVADMQANHVRVFDQDGTYVRTIGGGRGQGPGEFMMLRGIQITHDGKLRALDRMKGMLSDFTLDGGFIVSTRIKGVTGTILSICFDSRGRSYLESVKMNENNKMTVEITVYDSEFNLLKKIASKEVLQSAVGSFLPWRLANQEYIVYGDNETYEIYILNPDFKLIRKIEKEYHPTEVKKEEVESRLGRPLKSSDVLPKYYPAYGHISADEEGRIYVQTWETTETGSYYYDVFDAEGRYLTRFIFLYQFKPIWKNGRVFTIESDDDGLPLIRCYKITWQI
jgi:outer membrane protein assembly factor BamB